jgi:outer membrane immunogenic protein
MHKLLRSAALTSLLLTIPAAAWAADLPPAPPVYKTPVYAPPPFLWTGFYFGGNIGGAWNQGTINDSAPPLGLGVNFGNPSANGVFIGGGQVGANYQISSFVIGAEATFDWAANNHNSGPGITVPAGTFRVSSNNRWITTLAARFGVAIDHWLVYGKAGGGWVGANNFAVTNVGTGATVNVGNSNTNSGWLVGGGVEYAFLNNWTAKLEFDYLGLRNRTFTVPAGSPVLPGDTFTTTGRSVYMLTGGVNYLFNWGG